MTFDPCQASRHFAAWGFGISLGATALQYALKQPWGKTAYRASQCATGLFGSTFAYQRISWCQTLDVRQTRHIEPLPRVLTPQDKILAFAKHMGMSAGTLIAEFKNQGETIRKFLVQKYVANLQQKLPDIKSQPLDADTSLSPSESNKLKAKDEEQFDREVGDGRFTMCLPKTSMGHFEDVPKEQASTRLRQYVEETIGGEDEEIDHYVSNLKRFCTANIFEPFEQVFDEKGPFRLHLGDWFQIGPSQAYGTARFNVRIHGGKATISVDARLAFKDYGQNYNLRAGELQFAVATAAFTGELSIPLTKKAIDKAPYESLMADSFTYHFTDVRPLLLQ